MSTLVIYHKDCSDRFAAAVVYNMSLIEEDIKNTEYKPMHNDEDLPDLKGLDVIVLDMYFSLDKVMQAIKDSNSFMLLDHHKSALHLSPLKQRTIDLTKSACVMAWEKFHKGKQVPSLLEKIQEVDLKGPLDRGSDARAVHLALKETPHYFSGWESLIRSETHYDLVTIGCELHGVRHKKVMPILCEAEHVSIAGHRVLET